MWKRMRTFSLRTLLVLMFMTCLVAATWANYAVDYQREQETLKSLGVTREHIHRKSSLLSMKRPIVML